MTKKKGFFQRRWTDFRTGHGTYLVYFLAFMNFSILMYELVLVNIPGMQLLFPNIFYFLLVFLAIYIPLAAIIGWLHRRYQMPIDIALSMKQNPYWRDITQSLAEFEKGVLLIAQAKNSEAIEILQKRHQTPGNGIRLAVQKQPELRSLISTTYPRTKTNAKLLHPIIDATPSRNPVLRDSSAGTKPTASLRLSE